jgi:hypothetical protein
MKKARVVVCKDEFYIQTKGFLKWDKIYIKCNNLFDAKHKIVSAGYWLCPTKIVEKI